MQNGFAESFDGRLRDECLDERRFRGQTDARRTLDAWRADRSHARPHAGLGGLTPRGVAARSGEERIEDNADS